MKRFLFFITLFLALPSIAHGATNVYYSVGQTTDDLKTGSPTLTLTGGAGVFSVAQTGNIGVGDRVTYDVDNKIAYIAAKTNANMQNWTLVTKTGGVPTDVSGVTVTSITREYTSLSVAEAGATDANHINNSDLTAADVVLNLPCYYDTGADTTTVTIGGYTTDATRYIKIYTPNNTSTEVNQSQRHNGKWDDTKYRMLVSSTWTTMLKVKQSYTVIDGLQVDGANIYQGYGIATEDNVPYVNISIRNNIAKNFGHASSNSTYGIGVNYTTNTKIYNNIVYAGIGIGIWVQNYSDGTILSNNTVYGMRVGIQKDGTEYPVTAINNIASGNTTDFFAGENMFSASCKNNLSSDGTAPGTSPQTYKTVRFIDANNYNFHLHSLDTAALNAGADLSADANLAFSTDIDGHTRATLSTWDIGADEATTAIYRSVAPDGDGNMGSIAAGSTYGGLAISGSTASFDTPLTDIVGVGDALQYDSDSNGTIDAIAFIHERLSSTRYIIKKNDGTAPTATSGGLPDVDWGIFRAYTSLSNAETGTENTGLSAAVVNFDTWSGGKDLTTVNQQWNIAAYKNGATYDTTSTTINGWTTAQLNYIKIYTPTATSEVGTSQRHTGKEGTGYVVQTSESSARTFWIQNNYVRIEGLEVDRRNSYADAIASYSLTLPAEIIISSNLFYNGVSMNLASMVNHYSVGTMKVFNNFFFEGSQGSHGSVMSISNRNSLGANLYAYNNTLSFTDSRWGLSSSAPGNLVAKNNAVFGTMSLGSFYGDISGSYNVTSDANCNAGTMTNGLCSRTASNNFVDSATDLHIKSTAPDLKNTGTDLTSDVYLPLTSDVDGQTRPTGASTWDIGADERNVNVYYSVSGGGDTSTDRKTAATIQISSGVMIFSAAQTGNIGVGDEVIYGAGSKAYISGKIDQSNWYVTDALGDKPTDVAAGTTLTSIKRVWSSLSTAEAGATGVSYLNSSNLVTSGVTLNFPCYYDTGADTDAVTIDGYTTGANNYIKIYTPNNTTTETNNSQRHSGKWDDTKYRLEVSTSNVIDERVNYAKIQGIQIKIIGASVSGRAAIRLSDIDTGSGGEISIGNNIIKGELSGTTNSIFGVVMSSASALPSVKIFNNIIYDFVNSSYSDIYAININTSNATFYAYNNTVFNCYRGYGLTVGTFYAKNNIAQNCTDGYVPGFAATSDYNISDVSATDAPNATFTNDYATVSFADEANDDFHLAYTDTAARDAGADLRYDINLPITDDIDGHAKGLSPEASGLSPYSPDIGADEGTTAIYRSVGPGATGYIDRGVDDSNQLTISGSTATFSIAVPDNVGVGDVIQYDDDGDSDIDANDSLAFITGRISNIQYQISDIRGGTPTSVTNDTDWSIFRAYTSLSNAEGGATENTGIDSDLRNFDTWGGLGGKNIYATNEQWNIAAYKDAVDTSSLRINNWTTGSGNYVKIYTPVNTNEVGASQRHVGRLGTGFQLVQLSTYGIVPYAGYFWIDGIEISENSGSETIYAIGTTEIKLSNCIINYSGKEAVAGAAKYKIWNNIFYGDSRTITSLGSGPSYLYNNTFFCTGAYPNTSTAIYGSSGITAKNNIALGFGGSSSYYDFTGSFHADSDYNISSDNSAPGAHSKKSTDVTFMSENPAYYDFHLAIDDTTAKNAGANLSDDPNILISQYPNILFDIDGEARDMYWSIGADEPYGAKLNSPDMPGGSTITINSSLAGKMTSGLVGHWTFDGPTVNTSTNQAQDSSGQNNHGTISGATPVMGKRGQGMSFDGSDEIRTGTTSFSTNEGTWSAWVKDNGTADWKDYLGLFYDYSNYIRIEKNGTDDTFALFSLSGGVSQDIANTGVTIDSNWHFLAVTFSDSGNQAKFYIDGVERGTALNSWNGISVPAFFYIGNRGNMQGENVKANIDDVRIYNRALSEDEIGDLYNLGEATIRN